MKAVLKFLQKIGLLHVWWKTYAGKDVGGDFATTDYHQGDWKKKPPQTKVKNDSTSEKSSWLLRRKVIWILCILLGIFILFAQLSSGFALMLLGYITLPAGRKLLHRFLPFSQTTVWWSIVYMILILRLILWVSSFENNEASRRTWYSSPVQEIPNATEIATLKMAEWVQSDELVRDFSYDLARLVMAYTDARQREEFSLFLEEWDMSKEEYLNTLTIVELKWNDVTALAQKFEDYLPFARETITAIPSIQSIPFGIPKAYAQSMMHTSEVLNTQQRFAERKTLDEQKREQVELIKKGFPTKSRLEIIMTVFKEDADSAKQRLNQRYTDASTDYQKHMQELSESEVRRTLVENWSKIVVIWLWTPAALAGGAWLAWAAGWAAAAGMFLNGIDFWIAVWESIDIVRNNKEVWERKPIKDTVWTITWMSNVKWLVKNVKEWDANNILFAGEQSVKWMQYIYQNIWDTKVVFEYDTKHGKIYYAAEKPAIQTSGEAFHLNDRYVPDPHNLRLRDPLTWEMRPDHIARQLRDQELAKTKAFRSEQAVHESVKQLREEKYQEQKRIEAEMDKIIEQKEQARLRAAAQQQARDQLIEQKQEDTSLSDMLNDNLDALGIDDQALAEPVDPVVIDHTTLPQVEWPPAPPKEPSITDICPSCHAKWQTCRCWRTSCICCPEGSDPAVCYPDG